MAALVESNIQFKTVGDEAAYFIANIAKPFMGGWSGSGENGIDVTLPLDTPIYAVESGKIAGAGYYKGGGVVSVDSGPGRIWYYQHLDQNNFTGADKGKYITAGSLVGWSGGQNVGGNHPADPNYSSWKHIEIGLNAPWGGIWGNPSGQGNIDPVPALTALVGKSTSTGAQASASPPSASLFDPSTWVPAIEASIFSSLGIASLPDLLWRSGFILAGILIIILGFVVAFQHQIEEGVGTVVGAAAKSG